MVLAGIWTERRLRRAEERGRAQGEERANRRWVEWNQRREEAEATGEPFNEPLPQPDSSE